MISSQPKERCHGQTGQIRPCRLPDPPLRRDDRLVPAVFEAEIVNRDPALAFLTYDDEHHRFAFANLDLLKPGGGDADARGQIGVNHVAYTYANVADLLGTYERC